MFLYCGGHHDSDRTAVLVWSPRLKLLYCKYHQFMYTLPNKRFPSFLPSFLLVYINDIYKCSTINLLCFADDTTAYMSGPNVNDLIAEVNVQLIKLYDCALL